MHSCGRQTALWWPCSTAQRASSVLLQLTAPSLARRSVLGAVVGMMCESSHRCRWRWWTTLACTYTLHVLTLVLPPPLAQTPHLALVNSLMGPSLMTVDMFDGAHRHQHAASTVSHHNSRLPCFRKMHIFLLVPWLPSVYIALSFEWDSRVG